MTLYSLAVGTVICSSTGPIPDDTVLEVTASLLRPSGTHFCHTFELRAGDCYLFARVYSHGVVSVNNCICLRPSNQRDLLTDWRHSWCDSCYRVKIGVFNFIFYSGTSL